MDNLTKFKDLEINDLFKFDGVVWMKTLNRDRPDGGPLNAFDMRPEKPHFEHVDDDAQVKIWRPRLRSKKVRV